MTQAVITEEEKKVVEVLVNTSFEETRIAILENERVNEILWDCRKCTARYF